MNLLITQIILCLFVAFLLGGLLGWFLRSNKRKDDTDEHVWRQQAENRRTELMQLRTNLTDVEDLLQNANNELGELRQLNSVNNDELQRKTRQLEANSIELEQTKEKNRQLDVDFSAFRSESDIAVSRVEGRFQSGLDAQKAEIERLNRQLETAPQSQPASEVHELLRKKDLELVELQDINRELSKQNNEINSTKQALEEANSTILKLTAKPVPTASHFAAPSISDHVELAELVRLETEHEQALEGQYLAHKAELMTRDREMESARENIELLQTQHKQTENELTKIISELRQQEQLREDALQLLAQKEQQISQLNEQIESQGETPDTASVETLRLQLAEQSKQFETLYDQHENLSLSLTEKDQHVGTLQHRLSEYEQKSNAYQNLELKLAETESKLAELQENQKYVLESHDPSQEQTLKETQGSLQQALEATQLELRETQQQHADELEEVKAYVIEMEDEREKLESKLHEYSQRIFDLRRETADMDHINRQLKEAQLQLSELNETKKALAEVSTDAQNQLNEKEQYALKIVELEQQIVNENQAKNELDSLTAKLTETTNLANEREAELRRLQAELESQQSDIQENSEKNEATATQIRQRDVEIGNLRMRLTQNEKKHEELSAKLTNQKSLIKDHEDAQAKIDTLSAELNAVMEKHEQTTQQNQHQLKLMDASLVTFKANEAQLIKQLETAKQQEKALQEQVNTHVEKPDANAVEQERLNRLKEQYQSQQKENEIAHKQQMSELNQSLSAQEHELTVLKASLQNFKKSEQNLEEKYLNLQAVSHLSQAITPDSAELDALKDQNQKIEKDRSTLAFQVNEQAEVISELQSRVEDLSTALHEAKQAQENETDLDADMTLIDREQLDYIASTLQGLQSNNEQSMSNMRLELENLRKQLEFSRSPVQNLNAAEWFPSNDPIDKQDRVVTHQKTSKVHAVQRDDLQQINGITPVIERILNEQGVTSYRDVASFSAEDIKNYSSFIDSLPGRVERDQWISQAKYLHQLKYGIKL